MSKRDAAKEQNKRLVALNISMQQRLVAAESEIQRLEGLLDGCRAETPQGHSRGLWDEVRDRWLDLLDRIGVP